MGFYSSACHLHFYFCQCLQVITFCIVYHLTIGSNAGLCLFGFFFFVLSVSLLLVVIILSGQAFFGTDSANELLKTALLYVITAFISWFAKKFEMKDKKKTKKCCKKGKAEDQQRDCLVEDSKV